MSNRFALPLLYLLAAGPAASDAPPAPAPRFDTAAWLAHVRTLASDEFAGRAPGTEGEEKTVAYLAGELRKIGLEPAGPGGSWFQEVPLVGITGTPGTLLFQRGEIEQRLAPGDDFVAWTKRAVPSVELAGSELVFAGYGVAAPELGWDDFKGVDLRGKTMVVLVGDPPVPDPADPTRLDPATFGGEAMTYYGRWTYKYDAGAERGAAGVLIVHETREAGYDFSIVQGKLGEQLDLQTPDGNAGRPAVEGWLTRERAAGLFALAGHDFEALKRSAARRDFRPVPLGVTASLAISNRLRPFVSRNVAGRLPGSDPARRDEHVVVTAHWDHFGIGPAIDGETVRHGALDNASGVASLLELARAFAAAGRRPARSLLFLAVTAEEQGLLGSELYVRAPLVPLAKTAAVLNFEMMNVYGRAEDLVLYGLGSSELDDYVAAAATRQEREVVGDPAAEQGWFYRSDHFPFARRGVPAIWATGGERLTGKPPGQARRLREEFIAVRYHKPRDVVTADWDLTGVADDLGIYFDVAAAVADAPRMPEWRPGAEFRAAREAMLGRAPD